MLVARREGRKIAANGGILIEQLINPACHNGEIAANGETVTDAIFQPDGTTYFYIISSGRPARAGDLQCLPAMPSP